MYAYLEIYRKYNEDYGISDILCGNVKKSVYKRVFDADFDERITVVNLLLSGLTVVFSDVARERKMVQLWYEFLKEYRKSQRSTEEQHALYNSAVEQFSKNMEILKESSLILPKEYYIRQDVLRHIKGDFDTVMDDFTEESEKLSTMEDAAGENGVSGPNIQVGCVNGAIQECHHVLRVASFREVAHISACQRMGMQQQILSIRVTRLDEVEIGNRAILFLYTLIVSHLHSPEIVLSTSLITSNSVFFVLRFVELRCLLLDLERERCLWEWERRRWLLERE